MNGITNIETVPSLKTRIMFRRLSAVPLWSAAIVSLISVLVFVGWTFEIDFLKRIIPGYVFMNPTTAVAFILSSIALWLLQSADARRIRIARICAAAVLLVGLIKLCAIVGFFDIGIDNILYINRSFDSVTGQPNRMAPNTALNFLMFGAALLLFDVKTKSRNSFPAQYPAIVVLLTSFLAIIGYLYGAKSFYVIVSFNPMAIHTAVSFLLLAAGLLLSKPRQGLLKDLFSFDIGGQQARRLFPLVVIIPLVLDWLQLMGEQSGLFTAEIGIAMLTVATSVILGSIVINNARSMNNEAEKLTQTEKALSKAAKRERAIIENALDVICTIDVEGRFTSINPACFRMWGYQPEELIGHPFINFVAPEDVAKTIEADTNVLSGDEITNFENSHRHKNGTLVNVRWTSYWSESEQLVFAVAHDITERKQVEETLKASEIGQRHLAERQSAILDALPAHICLLDNAGKILEVNKEWKQFALENGYNGTNFGVGSNYLETCDNATGDCSEGSNQAADSCRAVLSGDSPHFEMEYPCHSPSEKRWFKLTVTPLHKEKLAGAVIMHVNVTERKRIEKELEQTRDAALESVRLKSEFLANMSHEIRTPMNGVIGMTGLLLDTNLSEEQRDYAQTTQSSADSLLRIIDDILDFSKIEAGQLHFEKIDFDLRECVESPIELLAERAQSKGIEIASLVYRDVPTLLCGDPGRLRQILTNLIGNAIKFTEKGEVTINVRKQSDAGNYVSLRFEITDTGIGISEQAQSRLFRAFTQADGSTTRKYGGTGLGLAISKQLVEMMGGEIGIESAPGKGSTFWFTARFEKQPNQTSTIQPVGNVSLEGVRVLIVDDNATNRKIFLHQTASWGMIAAEADSGEQALTMLRAAASREPFEIAILDLMMPEMDGFELARAIKSEPALSGIQLMLLPSYGKRGDGQIARDFGIAAYLQKPVRQSQLYNCLMTVIAEASDNNGSDQQSPRLITKHSLRSTTLPNSESKGAASKARILIAEDNAVNQKVALSQLKSLGYAADIVMNGREAVDAVKKHQYDVVLMDCQMPEMDGFEATAEIRRFEGDLSHTTIIAMTAHALEGEREKCLAAGMDDYISKPVKIETLKQTLKQWLIPVAVQIAVQPEAANVPADNKNYQSLDLSVLTGLRDLQQPNEPDIVTELIDLFLTDAGKRITAFKKAVAGQETAKIKEQAHAIKGSSSNIGALHIAMLSEKLEEKNLNITQMEVLITEIEDEFQEVTRILTDLRRSDHFVV